MSDHTIAKLTLPDGRTTLDVNDLARPIPEAPPTAPYAAELESGPDVAPSAGSSLSSLFVLRRGRETDRAWCTKAWVETNRHTPIAAALGPEYARRHSKLVWNLLGQTDVELLVAADPSEPDAVLGFLVRSSSLLSSPPVVHYVHVRKDMRRLGIAKALVGGLVARACTFSAQISDATWHRGGRSEIVPASWRYDPYALFEAAR